MKKEEISLAKWHVERIKENRKFFEYSDLSQNILEEQKDDDLLLLGDWLTELHGKLKPDDKRKDEVLLLIQSLWRVEKYCGGLETICKASTVRIMNYAKRNEELESRLKLSQYQVIQDKKKYDLEVETLKKQIEWTEKNTKA
jgi:hypothetical protein